MKICDYYLVIGLLLFLSNFRLGIFIKELQRRFYSEEESYGIRFDLTIRLKIPKPKIPLTLRKLCKGDIQKLFCKEKPLSDDELMARLRRLLFLRACIPTCFVAVTNDVPCLIVWQFTSAENKKIQSYFTGGLSWLKSDEVLFEFIYAAEDYRGLQVMHWAQSKLFKLAAENGYNSAIVFVQKNKTSSLKGCKRIGFKPFLIKISYWRYFRRTVIFKSIPPNYANCY